MSKITKKISVKEALSQCGYNNNIKNELILFLQSNYCNKKNKLYLFERNEGVSKLFLLLLKIPSKFKKETYDISILIYFPLTFPFAEPEIYFHKYCSIKINPHCLNYIDEQTLKINYEKFCPWENSLDSFKNIINEIYKQFNINFPIFTSNNKNENIENDEGDCFLKEQCCKEIEFLKPINNNGENNIQKLEKNQFNDKIKDMKSQNMNQHNNMTFKNNTNINNIVKENEQNIKQNINKVKRTNTNINTNTNNKFNIPETFDEKKSKYNLKKLLISQLYPKIK